MESLGLLGLLLLLFASRSSRGGSGGEPAPAVPGEPAGVLTSAPPWPQVVPAGLPAFPGNGWQYDEPPPAAVVQRAGQLVNQLWREGSGSYRIEQTAGRWIAYRAEIMRSGKKGVAAYRLATAARPLPAGSTAALPPSTPRSAPAAPAARAPTPPATPMLAKLPTDARILPTLRRGDGIKPKPPNDNVKLMQRLLGLKQDGQFGAKLEISLKTYQRSKGLDDDGVCGPKTWTQLLAVRA
jgi:peptidoglycan hydrolase-like protein with peptidoglycan-binding domain